MRAGGDDTAKLKKKIQQQKSMIDLKQREIDLMKDQLQNDGDEVVID